MGEAGIFFGILFSGTGGAWCRDECVARGGLRGGVWPFERAGGSACEQGVDGGDAASCADGVAGDGVGFAFAGGEPGVGAGAVAGEIGGGGEGKEAGAARGGVQGEGAQGEEVAGDEGEDGGGEEATGGDEEGAGRFAAGDRRSKLEDRRRGKGGGPC
jgi:hypothetical protein